MSKVHVCHNRTEPKEHECREAVWSEGKSCKDCSVECYRSGWSKSKVTADNKKLCKAREYPVCGQ